MDENAVVSFGLADEEVCEFVFPELVYGSVVGGLQCGAMLHTIRYNPVHWTQ